jgi:hypothetical protein
MCVKVKKSMEEERKEREEREERRSCGISFFFHFESVSFISSFVKDRKQYGLRNDTTTKRERERESG